MKRRVKEFRRKKDEKSYSYYWIGYQTRNEKGTPYFVREINISSLPAQEITRIDQALRAGEDEMVFKDQIEYHGGVRIGSHWAILRLCEDLRIYSELENKLSGNHSLAVLAMITDRVSNPNPYSKLMLSKAFPNSGLARIIGEHQIPFNDWYSSLDELHRKQRLIERELMSLADVDDTIFMYDITSIYFEGEHCPLAEFGYNRDGKKGKKQIVVGMLTNSEGRPLGVRVFEGNTKDETTVLEQMSGIKSEFNVDQLIFVGDRGMVTGSIRDELSILPESGIDYITGLTRREILKFANDDKHPLQASLFDEEVAEVVDGGLRYVLCFNPMKRDEDEKTRLRFLAKTKEKLNSVKRNVANGNYKKEKVIAKRLHRWLNHWGMEKCFEVEYSEGKFDYQLNQLKVDELARLDGCYVIVTTVEESVFDKDEVVARYKNLTWVEQIFRHMKTSDEFTRPIRHWSPTRVKGHVFMCMLAYLVIWSARNVFGEFLERDEETCMCEAGSLREIWESLDNGVSIGKIAVAGVEEEQLSPIPQYQKKLLKAAKATIGKAQKKKLKVA